jgi:hypothetical protein
VTEKKVCLWLQEVVFQIRKPTSKKKAKRVGKLPSGSFTPHEIVLTVEDLAWGEQRGYSRERLLAMLEEDRVDLDVDSVVDPETAEVLECGYLKYDTIYNSYISAIAEMYEFQKSTEMNAHPNFRGAALKALLDSKRSQQDQMGREQFENRGAGGLNSSYSEKDLLKIQRTLLSAVQKRPTVSIIFLLVLRFTVLAILYVATPPPL